MAFPTTGVLDSFVRANGALGTNWQSPVSVDGQTLTIIGNAAASNSSGAGMATWKASAFSTKIEAYAQISVLPGTGNYVGVSIIDDPASPSNGYVLEVTQPSSWALYSYVSGSIVSTYTGTQTLSAGDWIGLYATHGSQIAYYSHDGTTWTAIVTATDTALTVGSWYSAMEIARATGRISQFGGGTTVTASTITGASAVALTDSFASAGVRQTFGATASSLADAFASSGTRQTFAASALSTTDSFASAGVRTTLGAAALTVTDTFTTTTSGPATVTGATAFTIADVFTAGGSRITFGTSALTVVDTATIAGLLSTFGASALTETVSIVTATAGLPSTYKTFYSSATLFKTWLHGAELSISFPHTAASQEEEWLLDVYLPDDSVLSA